MKKVKIIALGLILALILNPTISFSSTNTSKTINTGIYKVTAGKSSNKAIEMPGANLNNNVQAGIWDYGNGLHQKLYFEYQNDGFYKITIMHTGKSLTVKNNNITEGTEIVQNDYQGANSQKWIVKDNNKGGYVISPSSNSQLAISVAGNIQNGAKLILSKTQDNDKQIFYLSNISAQEKSFSDGTYKIAVGRDINKTIEVPGANINNNVQLGLWDYGNGEHQKLKLEYQSEGFYKITIMHTGKSLTVKNNNIKAETEIVQNDYQGLNSQKWILRDSNKGGWIISPLSNPQLAISIAGNIQNGAKLILSKTQDNDKQIFYIPNVSTQEKRFSDGIYKIAVGIDVNKTIEVPGANINNNVQLGLWDYGNGEHQRLYIEYQSDGFYKITTMHTGKSLTVKNDNIKAGIEIVQNDYQGLNSQKWILRDSNKGGWIISPLSNPQLAISIAENIQNGSKLILSKTQDNYNQMFCIYNINANYKTRDNGTYEFLVAIDENKGIEIPGGNTSNNANVGIWDYRKCFTSKI